MDEHNFHRYDEHSLDVEELCTRLNTHPVTGLTSEVADARFLENGPNRLKPPKEESKIFIFLKSLFYGFSLMLWIASILSLFIYFVHTGSTDQKKVYLSSSIALIVVVVVTGAFSFLQNQKKTKLMESFMAMIPDEINVVRDGNQQRIPPTHLVAGDLIHLKAGDLVPADIRIVESNDMAVDNSNITGESDPCHRTVAATDGDPMEADNLAFFSSSVLEGYGAAIVIRTGDATLMGHLATLTSSTKSSKTGLLIEIERFMRMLGIFSGTLVVVCGIAMYFLSFSWMEAVTYLIAVVISTIPQGMVTTLALSLNISAERMASANCVVKRIETVESLGATSIICTDKTGTLTLNSMSVSHLWFDRRVVNVYLRTMGVSMMERGTKCLKELASCAILSSDAEFENSEDREPIMEKKINGNATEAAIIRCFEYVNRGSVTFVRQSHEKIFEKPFNSVEKYQLSVQLTSSAIYKLVMKGSPESVIGKCTSMMLERGGAPMSEKLIKEVENAYSEFALMGERVLACADMEVKEFPAENFECPTSGFRFLGLISLNDPPRPAVPSSVMLCRRAGIKVIMVTGDHPLTAESIARKVNIISDNSNVQKGIPNKDNDRSSAAIILLGREIRDLTYEELDNIIKDYDEIVCARVSPQDKLKIVESCQRTGAVVAVTGDGINDAPAIKKADIGIAMGISGNSVVKQSADIILLDDNFASIVSGIAQGRLVYENLKKSITFTLSHTIPELLPFLLHIFLGIPSPIGFVAILIIDLGIDLFLSISLAHEDAEEDLMNCKPRDMKRDRLISLDLISYAFYVGSIEAAAGILSHTIVMAESGWWPSSLMFISEEWYNTEKVLEDVFQRKWSYDDRTYVERVGYTAVFASIVLTQMANVFVCKASRGSSCERGMWNWYLNISILFSFCFALFVIYSPFMSALASLKPLRFELWLPPIPFALLIILIDEWRHLIIHNNPGHWIVKRN